LDGPTNGPTDGRTTRLLELLRAAKKDKRTKEEKDKEQKDKGKTSQELRKAALRVVGCQGVKV
jgi:hypothetical protein